MKPIPTHFSPNFMCSLLTNWVCLVHVWLQVISCSMDNLQWSHPWKKWLCLPRKPWIINPFTIYAEFLTCLMLNESCIGSHSDLMCITVLPYLQNYYFTTGIYWFWFLRFFVFPSLIIPDLCHVCDPCRAKNSIFLYSLYLASYGSVYSLLYTPEEALLKKFKSCTNL